MRKELTVDEVTVYQADKESNKIIDVTREPIIRGNHAVEICGIQYSAEQYDAAIESYNIVAMSQDNTCLYLEDENGTQVIQIKPIDKINDTNTGYYRFVPKGRNEMHIEKVVGTTFRFKETGHRYYDDFAGKDIEAPESGVPTRECPAILWPEPENAFDEHAVAVLMQQVSDGKPYKIGYLARGSELYNAMLKNPQRQATKVVISAYSETGDFNDTYAIKYEGDLV